ncbi:MAG: hypothetical protein ACKVHU_10905 [Acidimicrobiales bacterium]|jgi:hypothetical protein
MGSSRLHRLTLSSASVASGLLGPAMAVVLSLIVARREGLSMWGSVARVQIASQVLALICTHGVRDLLLTSMAIDPAGADYLWWRAARRHLTFGVVGATAAMLVFGFSMTGVIAGLWVLGLVARELIEALVVRRGAFMRALAGDVLSAVVVIALVRATGDSRVAIGSAIVLGLVLRTALIAPGNLPPVRSRSAVSRSAEPSAIRPKGSQVRRNAFATLALAGYVQSRGDTLVATAVLSDRTLGLYVVAMNAVQVMRGVIAYAMRPHAPALHRLRHRSVSTLARRQFVLWSPIVVAVGLLIPWALGTWWKGDVEWWWSFLVIATLATTPWRYPWTNWLLGRGDEAMLARVTTAVSVAVLILAWPALAFAGLAGGLVVAVGAELSLALWTRRRVAALA